MMSEYIIDEDIANKICVVLVNVGENRLANKLCSRPHTSSTEVKQYREERGDLLDELVIKRFELEALVNLADGEAEYCEAFDCTVGDIADAIRGRNATAIRNETLDEVKQYVDTCIWIDDDCCPGKMNDGDGSDCDGCSYVDYPNNADICEKIESLRNTKEQP